MNADSEDANYSEPATGSSSLMSDSGATGIIENVVVLVGSNDIDEGLERGGFRFTISSTKMLINLMVSHVEDVESRSVTSKAIFESIAETMTRSGFNVTWRQVKDKWGGLRRTYRHMKLDTKTSRENRRKWPFWSDMNSEVTQRIMAYSTAAGSGHGDDESSANQKSVRLKASTSNESHVGSCTGDPHTRPKSRKRKIEMEEINWETYLEKREIEKQESMAEKKKFNELFAEFVDFIKKRDH